ncbi:MAG TPA: hypothetical protein VGJ84_04505 [Polyangiaceae bacterium]
MKRSPLMSEPKRWRDDGAPEAVARMFSAAQGEEPGKAGIQRTLATLGLGTSASAAAGASAQAGMGATAAAKTAAISGTGILIQGIKWGLAGTAALAALIGVTQGVRRFDRAKPQRAPSAQHQAVANPPAHAAPPAQRAEAPATESARTVSPVADPPLLPSARTSIPTLARSTVERPNDVRRAATIPADAISAEQLAEETRLVDAARRALAEGRAAQSLVSLDEHQRRFSERRLAPEALYIRMEALLALGRLAEAQSVAQKLLGAYPDGPQAARARVVLATPPPTP